VDTTLTQSIPLYNRNKLGVKQDLTSHIQSRNGNERLSVTYNVGKKTGQKVGYVVAPSSGDVKIRVHNNTLDNVLKGVVERVFLVKRDGQFSRPPKPVANIFNVRLRQFRCRLISGLSGISPYTFDEFIGCYTGRRRTRYGQAKEELLRDGAVLPSPLVKGFGKVEKFNFSVKPNSAMRIISPRSYPYNLEVGCYIKALEHPIYGVVKSLFGEVTIFKGLNAEQQGFHFSKKWSLYSDPIAIGIDAERFDQHVSRDCLEWEHSIYNAVYSSSTLRELLKLQLRNIVGIYSADWSVKYTVDGCRMSGDMNTALGNCLIMCAIVYSYLHESNIKLSLANNGDDCVLIMDRSCESELRQKLPQYFLEFGFSIKMEDTVECLEHIEFCQSHPVFDGKQYVMVRDPRVAISKDCYSIKPLDNKAVYESWISAVGQGGLSLTGGIPVWQNFYRGFIRASCGRKPLIDEPSLESGMVILGKNMERRFEPVDEMSRVSFYEAFGIPPNEQLLLEQYYDNNVPYWASPDVGVVPTHQFF